MEVGDLGVHGVIVLERVVVVLARLHVHAIIQNLEMVGNIVSANVEDTAHVILRYDIVYLTVNRGFGYNLIHPSVQTACLDRGRRYGEMNP